MSKDLQILTTDIGWTWYEALEDVFKKDWFRKLNDYVLTEREAHNIYPSPAEVWSWTTRVSISQVKVVILHQDPRTVYKADRVAEDARKFGARMCLQMMRDLERMTEFSTYSRYNITEDIH